MSKEYNIGIYIRLSMADEDTGYGSKAESDSIGNQRMLINRFLDNHPELSIRSCLTVSGLSLRMTVIPARTFTVLSSRR